MCYRFSHDYNRGRLHPDNRDVLFIGIKDFEYSTTNSSVSIQFEAVKKEQRHPTPDREDPISMTTRESDDLFQTCLDFDFCSMPYTCNAGMSEQSLSTLAAAVVLTDGNRPFHFLIVTTY